MAYSVLLGLLVAGHGALPVAAARMPDATPAAVTPGSTPATIAAAMPCDELVARDFSKLADASIRIASAADVAVTGSVVRNLPAFAYPLPPQYTGTGDVNDAQNYVPVLPAPPPRTI